MESMINDILTLERIEARYREAEPIVWCDLIQHAIETLRVELDSKRHMLEVECAPDLPSMRGDAVQLGRALFNLMHNAVKYTPPGGRIKVRAYPKNYRGKITVAVEVEDNGIGVSADQQTRLFESFYRAHQNSAELIPGAGLGLSVVKAAVEYHKGRVYFDSAPDKGSLFGFWVPI